jgi:hypothetical protein
MPTPFYEADDRFDAAADAVRFLSDRLISATGLDFTPESFDALREVLAAALVLIEVEGVEG